MRLAAILGCVMAMAVLAACTDNSDNPATGNAGKIVGSWFSDVSGKTFAK